jgi:hypothetical protein
MSAAPFGPWGRIGEQNRANIRPYSCTYSASHSPTAVTTAAAFMRQIFAGEDMVIKMQEGEHATLLLKARGNKTLWRSFAIGQNTNRAHSRDVHCELLSSGGLDCCKCGCGVVGEEGQSCS